LAPDKVEKEEMRALILRGGPWSEDERTAIFNYCEGDVDALDRLLPAMLPKLDLPRALVRGRYMAAAAAMIAYVDWSQQEIGIAAALSGDPALQAAYLSGDCYLAFAKQAGAVPQDASKGTHGAQRELFKQCMLAVQYGMEWQSLAMRIAQPGIVARDLLRAHRETYWRFWQWSDAAVDQAMLVGVIPTVFGWPVRVGESRTLAVCEIFRCRRTGRKCFGWPAV
jgi:hypothetical protein